MFGAAADAARPSANLSRFLDPSNGAALLLDVRSKEILGTNGADLVAKTLAPPGSTIKPFVLAALLRSRKITPNTAFPCPRQLTIGDRKFDCSHPKLVFAVQVDTALAYSCNCFVARAAQQFAPGELARELQSFGLNRAQRRTGDEQRVQALGEAGVLVTASELAMAYRQLPNIAPILEGLEGAVEFGTAQNARVAGVTVAGKTGTSSRFAWFAGFMPSRAPEVVVTVMLSGRSGGADAAPVAAQILAAYKAGKL